MTDDVAERLFRCLAEELDRRGHDPHQPVRVSELYQELVPYRSVRPALGVELKGDYEHALLRLLAGERGLLRLEPQQARDELRREVDAPYPFVGLFRKFSASHVWIDGMVDRPEPPVESPIEEPADAGEADPESRHLPGSEDESAAEVAPAEVRDDAPATAPDARPARSARPGPPAVPLRPVRGAASPAAAPVRLHREPAPDRTEERAPAGPCAFCSLELPAGRHVRFCPHCGGDQRLRPCPRCDAILERDWRYCISCGHEVGAT